MQKNRISINQIKNKQIMNKKVMKAVFVAAIAMVSGINVFNAQKSEGLSDIAWTNVEALASGETTVECCASLWGICKDGIPGPYVKCTFN